MNASQAQQARLLAAHYHARAKQADPPIARILNEIAMELEEEARKLEAS